MPSGGNGLGHQPFLRRCNSRPIMNFEPTSAVALNSLSGPSLPDSRRRRHFSADDVINDHRRRLLLQARRQGRQLSDPTTAAFNNQVAFSSLSKGKPPPSSSSTAPATFKGPRTLMSSLTSPQEHRVTVKAGQRSP